MKKLKIPKEVEINGVTFENINPFSKKGLSIVADVEKNDLLSISQIYERPSNTKIEIYDSWLRWFLEIDGCVSNFGCLRGNSFSFSIGAYFIYNDCAYWCYITPAHNYAVRVSTHLLWEYQQTLFFEKGIKL